MELIKIIEYNGKQAVSARELHSFLESKQDFSNWIKNRIEKYGFVENVDFQSFNKIIEREVGATNRIEYALTIDCAKELSMVEGNEKGKIARKYFINCEKQLKSVSQFRIPQTYAEALKLAAIQAERLELQESELKKQAPKVEYYNEVLQSQSTYNTNQIAKELGTSAVTLNRFLASKKIQYKQNDTWLLYHKYQNRGYTKTKTHPFTGENGEIKTRMLTVWTEEGRLFIHGVYNSQRNSLMVTSNNDYNQ